MKLLIGADLVPTNANLSAYQSGDLTAVIDPALLDLLKDADYRIFDLECPLTDGGTPIGKCGPSLKAPVSAVCGLKALGADFVTLANNHILDYGEQGLEDTFRTLTDAQIAYAGAGKGEAKSSSHTFTKDGLTLGVYCCTEHEFSVTSPDCKGAVPYDPADSTKEIARLKETCDRVIVLYHGGKEMWQYPTPLLRERCQRLARAGADLVVCQHSHCVGCRETVGDCTVLYGQGNFHFDLPDEQSELWCTALLFAVELTADGVSVDPIPLRLAENRLTLATAEDAASIVEGWNRRSEELAKGSGQAQFDALVDETGEYYLSCLTGKLFSGFFPRLFNKLTGGRYKKRKLARLYDREMRLCLYNYIQCETHREMLAAALLHSVNDPAER